MNNYEIPITIAGIGIGIALIIGSIVFAAHISAQDALACIEVIKDKSAQDILLICKGR